MRLSIYSANSVRCVKSGHGRFFYGLSVRPIAKGWRSKAWVTTVAIELVACGSICGLNIVLIAIFGFCPKITVDRSVPVIAGWILF